MNPAEYGEMFRLEGFYWWFVARRRLLESVLEKSVRRLGSAVLLDAGCGTGINHSVLSRFGTTVSLDPAAQALAFCRSRGVDRLVSSRLETLAFAPDSFDVATALDVLEHVDDDLAAMAELARVAKPGSLLVVTVPAYGFLWSEHDEALHHRRRYAASELRNKLTRSGFEVERISYYVTLLFFPIFVMRFWQSVFKKSVYPKTAHVILPPWLNSVLIAVLGLERRLLQWINFPFGVSLICTARKSGPRPVAEIRAGE